MKLLGKSMSILGVLGLLLTCAVTGAETREKRPMTVDDMLDLVRIDDVVMTPDGSRVFYSERRLNWETNKYEKTLFAISSQGGDPVAFVRKDWQWRRCH
jgi:hypothetical protein